MAEILFLKFSVRFWTIKKVQKPKFTGITQIKKTSFINAKMADVSVLNLFKILLFAVLLHLRINIHQILLLSFFKDKNLQEEQLDSPRVDGYQKRIIHHDMEFLLPLL